MPAKKQSAPVVTNAEIQEQFKQLAANMEYSRTQLLRLLTDPRRDIEAECGYPETEQITIETYKKLYDRDPVANRVVGLYPSECWMVQPIVYEKEKATAETDFELAWKDLGDSLRGGSKFKGEGSPIWEYLARADELSGIGHFGVILLGLDDGKDLREPAEGIDAAGRPTAARPTRKLLFMRVFDESLVQISRFETDPSNPRYGQPVEYNITLNDPRIGYQGATPDTTTKAVHWTRVIHVADNLRSSEIFGTPRMLPVYDRIHDLRKLYGGSAEMYWRGAFPGLSIESHPQLGGDVGVDQGKMKDMMENYMNGLQRYLALMGFQAKSLAPQVVDPTPQINIQVEGICIELACPKRKFMGSERGELASSQDESDWNDRLGHRQNTNLTPRLIVPAVDRLVGLGCLPEPEEYHCEWPDMNAMSDDEKATVAQKRTEAMSKYVAGGVEALMAPVDYLHRELDYTIEEAEAILETAAGVFDDSPMRNLDEPEPIIVAPGQAPPGMPGAKPAPGNGQAKPTPKPEKVA